MFGSGPSTSTPAVQLAEVQNEVWALISDGMFYEMSGVLTLVVTHHPDLDFAAICTNGCRAGLRAVGDGVSPFERG